MHRLAVAVLSVAIFISISHAQNSDPNNDTGLHPYETYDGVRESINLGTGNVLVSVPLLTIPEGHGHSYSVTLTSNSQTWSGNSGGYPQNLGMVFSSAFWFHPTGVTNPANNVTCLTGYVLSDQSGAVHSFGGIQSNCIQTGGGPNQGMRLPQYDILTAGDDRSEMTADLNTSACRVTFRDGSWFPLQTGTNGCPLMGMANTASLIDSNGNGFSLGPTSSTCTGGLFCGGGDTLPGSSGVIQYNDSNGVQRTISLILQAVSLSSCVVVKGGVSTPLSGTYNLISGAVLPNGLTYIFHYDQCGNVDKIVYPSGGYTRYVFDYTHYLRGMPHYSGGYTLAELTAKYVCRAASVTPGATSTAAGNTCPVSEDTTLYSPTTGGYGNSANQVTDPSGNVTQYQFATCVYPFQCETSRRIYQGAATLLRTIQTTYSVYYPATKTTILPNGLQSKVEWDYWTLDNVKEKREYAWGNGAPGALARKTDYGSAYCYTKPPNETVYDGSNNQIAKTTYGFDDYTRCNVTAIQRWRNTDGATLTTSMQYDVTGNVLSVTDPLGHVTTTSYSGVWGDTTCLPPGGASAAFPTQVTDPVGLITKHSYNSCTNTIATSTDPNSQVTSFSYDLMDRVIQTTSPDGGQTSACFSEVSSGSCYSSSYPLKVVATQKITSSVNKTSTTILDGLARVTQTQTSDPDCSSGAVDKVDITYDSNERKSTVTNPYCTTSDTTYGLTTYNYDALDRVTKVIPPDGTGTADNVTTSYDSLPVVGNPIINCTLVTDQAGNQRRSCSDALGRLIEVDEPGSLTPGTPGTGSTSVSGATQTYSFNPCQGNQPPAPTDCTQTVFDSTTIYVTIGTWSTSINAGNSGDTPAIVASRLAVALSVSGSPVSAVASGSTVTVTARWTGASTNYTIGTSTTYNTQFFFGPAFTATSGTMTGGTDGNPGTGPPSINSPLVTLYQYDLLNNLTRVDQKGNQPSDSTKWRTRSFTYDSLSQLLCAANPEITPIGSNCPASATGTFPAGAVTYGYDSDGNLTTKTSPKPNQASSSVTVATTYSYDLDNRLTQKSYNDSFTPTVKYGYDGVALSGCTTAPPTLTDTYPKGRRTSMCDKSGATSWSHDKMGRTASEKRTIVGTANVTKSTPSTYNLDGSLATLTNPGTGTVITYTYNAAGRATSGKDNGSGINYAYNATYAPFGGLAALSMGSKPITVSNQYNKRLQPGVLSASTVSATIMSFSYDFHLGTGDNGNVFTIRNDRDDNRTQNFTYDALNRIATSYTNGSNWGEDFTIDAWGNLSNRSAHPGKTNYEPLSAAATNQNRLAGFGYDAAGNMTSNGGASYTYDAENHLVLTSGYAYFYDGDGNRMKKCTSTAAFTCQTSPTGTLYWRGAGSDPLIETTLGGTNQEEYIFLNGKRIARRDVSNSAVHYYFSDHLGSTSMSTDANGTMSACPTNSTLITGEDESDYYPYGGELALCSRVAQNYKFTGKERDVESGLDNFLARFDASSLGRFMTPDWSADPVAVPYARFESPQSLNLYAYAQNNPTTLSDPSGHQETLGTQAMERDNRDFLAGRITEQQWKERQQARAAGVAIGLGMLGAIYTGSEAYASTFLRNLIGLAAVTAPRWEPIVLDTIEGMTPGAPGTLTIARNTRLTEQEVSAGVAYARQTGTALIQSSHVGEEFVDAMGKTYDVMQPGAAQFWNFSNQRKFIQSLIKHVKEDDVVIMDLRNASKEQVSDIKGWISQFNNQCARKIHFLDGATSINN